MNRKSQHRSEDDNGDSGAKRNMQQNLFNMGESHNSYNNNNQNLQQHNNGNASRLSVGRNGVGMMQNNGKAIAEMMARNNVQGFNGPAETNNNNNQQHESNNAGGGRRTVTEGPFYFKTDRNGVPYMVDKDGNPVQLGGSMMNMLMNASGSSNNSTSNFSASQQGPGGRSSRSRAAGNNNNNNNNDNVVAPGPIRQGALSMMNNSMKSNNSSSNNNKRGLSVPAETLLQPSKPVRNSASSFTNNNNMMNMMMNTSSSSAGNSSFNNNNMSMNRSQQQQAPFLALPRRQDQREIFTGEFLARPWVRHYAFANNDVAFMYYCLQPGRYGAFYQGRHPTIANRTCTSTLIIDVHSKLVLHVPVIGGKDSSSSSSMKRRQQNNNNNNNSNHSPTLVDTDYDDEAAVLPLSEAQARAGSIIGGILDYINELAEMKADGQVPCYVSSAFIHNADSTGVPANTKFVYLRRVFADPGSSFSLFRLSNKASQIICPLQYDFDVRWEVPRNNNNSLLQQQQQQMPKPVGLKYYVYRDGTTQPFTVDTTGLLAKVENVLTENYESQNERR